MAAIAIIFLLFFFFHSSLSDSLSNPLSESDALLLLKSSFSNPNPVLSSWTIPSVTDSGNVTPTPPCAASWTGVQCKRGTVTGLRLAGLGLHGAINVEALSHIRSLRSVSFKDNKFSGPLPNIGRLDALKSVFLSNNRFSGPIDDSIFSSMDHLKKLWLDGNRLSGKLPSSLSKSSKLIELHLDRNDFTGAIPTLNLPFLRSFNVSNNNLQGSIPASLVHFGAASFAGNPNLCGPPLPGPPCPSPTTKIEEFKSRPGHSSSNKFELVVLIILLIFFTILIGYAAIKSRHRDRFADSFTDDDLDLTDFLDTGSVRDAVEAAAAASPVQLPSALSSRRPSRNRIVPGGSELVMLNEEKGVFALPDLLAASAEVLGNGGIGSAYRAALDNGVTVAVKRMRELNRLNKEGFEEEMRRLGRLRHPHLLPPLAYHFRKEEKLIVSEYIPKGSLVFILHGDRGADNAALDWPTRFKIIRGIARAMRYLHAELPFYDLPHGNLKSANVLLAHDFQPIVADYGLIAVINPDAAPNVLFAYKSPESPHVSPKSDVFCFGIIVLEILTGKFPSLYLKNAKGGTDIVHWAAIAVSEKREADYIDPRMVVLPPAVPDIVRLFRLGVACTKVRPEERPWMKEAADMVDEIAGRGGGGIETVRQVGPRPPWREGSLHRSHESRRWERPGEPAQEQWSGDLLSL